MTRKANVAINGLASIPTRDELLRLLGKPPLLRTEPLKEFFSLFERFSAALQPRDLIEAISVWFYTIKTFELVRAYRIRTGIVERARTEAVYSILEWIGNLPMADVSLQETVLAFAKTLFHTPGKARDELLEFLAKFDIDEEAITAEAVKLSLEKLEIIDRSIALIEAGRNAMMHEMLFYRQELRPRFRELEEELPALVEQGPPLLAGDRTSDNSAEPDAEQASHG